MGRGVSYGGGQSSLGYLFGSGEAPKPAASPAPVQIDEPVQKPSVTSPPPVDARKQISAGISAGISARNSNNYVRADGQNTGNFITDRPSTKVQAAPGGGSSLDYLFGGGSSK